MKQNIISNTAAATIRQFVTHMFECIEKVEGHDENSKDAKELSPIAADGYYLFQDLCLLANNDSAQFLEVESFDRVLGLELIESILTSHRLIFFKVFSSLIGSISSLSLF